ncbi:DNA alkylation repair protein [Evansella sp. AB-rgal1]|uniref:DNA alkylation repair protein n=1 Tax=Evansella sp. AB-rgal1 TaxID=3242696 RepID=UPI00359CCEC6
MYKDTLIQIFSEGINEENRIPMENYMKNKFPFLGIKTPQRKELLKKFYDETGILKEEELPLESLKEIWSLPEREFQYAVLSILVKKTKWIVPEHMSWLEELVITKSWWDTVDTIAPNIVGHLFSREPDLITKYIPFWKNNENFWLRRSAILFQLKYKEKTDVDLLFHIIEVNKYETEFFIRKAIGWALREYSKTDAEIVEKFILSNQLSTLSAKEGMKHIERVRMRL